MPVWIGSRRLGLRHLLLLAAIPLVLIGFSQAYQALEAHLQQRTVAALSWILSGKTIVVDAGHGGIDTGVGKGPVAEKDVNLEIALKLAELLRQGGATVLTTRDNDHRMGTRYREDLALRVRLAEEQNADLFISIHANSYPRDPGQRGAQTFFQRGEEDGAALSRAIQAEIIRILANTDRTPKGMDFFLGRNASMPTVIVETGFVTNPREFKLLQDPGYQQKMAFAIYCGIVKYLAEQATPATKWVDEKIIETFRRQVPETVAP
ncbi:N-acetylmuramoyl-L-alanine amidase family protein [Candidatus Desulforudis audaxviator]|uniref:N-acetylmuramoyl-L-alanine amidase n=1 Tax=Desulforudis audaxviator (strain MP104C) TaxID=477974 RepID=B1I1E7_DESAP|nr:N-acetylmuramoyl-L-alanine amidase [Candidatus Desulforudis audaxviator]ACA58890.1 N-acetylmuramoyl-L-alanine amidase [Candidatus Desulforudis audaxviator MP104C]AZK58909.1 N-acetylmuramoyl-L-alanine amidase [Candidatus Desulforudis audaxviator]